MDVTNVAEPPVNVTSGEIAIPPSRKITDPDGLFGPVTVAVRVTGCPTVDGLGEDASVVDVAMPPASRTSCEIVFDVLPA